MKRNFTNENFEEFLRQSAENLQMRPSAKVWQGVSEHFNRRRRTGIVIAISLLITTALSYYFVSDSNSLQSTGQVAKTQLTKKPIVEQSTSNHLAARSSGSNKQKVVKKISRQNLSATSQHSTSHALVNTSDVSHVSENNFTPTVVDSNDENPLIENVASVSETQSATPLTIESVFNSYQPAHKSKLGLQFYFAPTISFRRVNDNTVNKIVQEKPNFGFEAGFAAKYPVTKNLKIKGGLQFNINSYSVKTFETYTQTATIRVNDQNGTTYVNSLTNYNNFSGYQSKWLQNFYFQLAAPIGVELKLKGDNTTQFGIASTLQPTYLLGNKAYLISSDYKNYAMFPNLIRHWNLSTSLETYVAYSTGHLKWQVGPQVRYQLLSSYIKKYPVKENLFGFGLKVGVSLNNR